uniref:Uncharacterized protein n=1 Tax=Arundo donax TaxID=35708 RepID=A0A0A9A6R9_ARUDO
MRELYRSIDVLQTKPAFSARFILLAEGKDMGTRIKAKEAKQ